MDSATKLLKYVLPTSTAPTFTSIVKGTFTIVNTDLNVCVNQYEDPDSDAYKMLANTVTKEVSLLASVWNFLFIWVI